MGTGKDADRNSANFRMALSAMMSVLKDGPSKSVLITLTETAVTGDESVSSELAKLSLIGRTLEDQLYLFSDFKSEKPTARKLNKVLVSASNAGKAPRSLQFRAWLPAVA